MSETYRQYNDFVPDYLRECPHQVIIHCLQRKSSSKKYDILTKDVTTGKFTLQGSGKVYTINFGVGTGDPSCTCPDWLQWHIPCKHFFGIFHLVEGWGWMHFQICTREVLIGVRGFYSSIKAAQLVTIPFQRRCCRARLQ